MVCLRSLQNIICMNAEEIGLLELCINSVRGLQSVLLYVGLSYLCLVLHCIGCITW